MSNIDIELDVRGLTCPMPLLKARQALTRMTAGQVLRVLATDPGSVRDFQSYAELTGHSLLESSEGEGVFIHTLKKHG